MCGIVGFFNSDINPNARVDVLKDMMTRIVHRGPDEAGYFIDDQVAMGTVRLSIIDILKGSQPMSCENRRFWLSYNGEIYNYIELRDQLVALGYCFSTSSDTEVVLHAWRAWGKECLSRFNGAFAFAIYDRHERQLFLARDRFGKRPLFYSLYRGGLLFGSEMKAFLDVPDFHFQWDVAQVKSILAQWTPLPDQTGFKDIEQLPMGCVLSIVVGNHGKLNKDIETYSSLNFTSGVNNWLGDKRSALDAIRSGLKKSVELRMRSDVDVGVYLSGGLDSSIITDLCSNMTARQIHTFSVEFADQEFDESNNQKLVSDRLGTHHTALQIVGGDIVGHFPSAVYHAEVPVFRTAFVPMFLLSKTVKNRGIKVILSGEGADETFLGYNLFKDTLLRRDWHALSDADKLDRLAKMYPYLAHYSNEHKVHMLGLYQQYTEERMKGLFSHEMRFQNGRFAARLIKDEGDPFIPIMNLVQSTEDYESFSSIERAQWLEFKTLLSGYLLSTQGERMGLAHGVENRCPFLDPNIVKLSNQINLKFDDGFDEKHMLKQAFKGILPDQIIQRNKQPYRAPDSYVFVDNKADYIEALFHDGEMRKLDFINTKFAGALINKIFTQDKTKISTKENQAFVFLVSLILLNNFYVLRTGFGKKPVRNIDGILMKKINLQSSPASLTP